MSKINVKAVEGRVAYTAPRGGKIIPTDRAIPVDATPWIMRLLRVWGDIEIVDEKTAVESAPKILKPEAPAAEAASTSEKK